MRQQNWCAVYKTMLQGRLRPFDDGRTNHHRTIERMQDVR
jgi:hypothetical protein